MHENRGQREVATGVKGADNVHRSAGVETKKEEIVGAPGAARAKLGLGAVYR